MEDRRQHIISAAQKLFAHYGLKKTTMDEIAKAARMGKATLYYYFKNKNDVFSHFIQKELIVIQQELNEAISTSTSPKEKLVNYIRTRYKIIMKYKEKYPVLKTEYLQFYSLFERIREGLTNYETTAITDMLKEGVKQDMFMVDNVKATAQMVITILKGVEFPMVLGNEKNVKPSELERFTNILLKGIEKT